MTTPTDLENQPRGFLDRVIRTAWVLVFLGAAAELVIFRSMSGVLSLTAAGTVAIINFRWLEVVVQRVVQPGRPSFTVSSILRIIGRFALLGVVLAALVWVPQIDPVAVALGFTALVVALIIEGARGGRVGGG
jgi:predicted neutral ceramidase superfamily lipid hydrolase